jgi:Ca-activated chloride channel homolog
MLWLLVAVPLLVFAYAGLARMQAGRGAQLVGLATTSQGKLSHARYGPALLLLLGIALLLLAMARPKATVVLPARADAIILAIDVSGSMKATDVKPTRLSAAQAAAKTFVGNQPAQVRVGVVTMAATAQLVQAPTDKRDEVLAAIDRFQTENGSALGSGLVIALQTLLPESGIDVQKLLGDPNGGGRRDFQRQAETLNFKAVPPGSNPTVAVVLVSDGESNVGPDLVVASKLAADRGVRVYTVGIGTKEGAVLKVEGYASRVRLDEEALKKLSLTTRGEYFRAGSATDLTKVYKDLSAKISMGKGRSTELTVFVVALGALLAMLGALWSVMRDGRVV